MTELHPLVAGFSADAYDRGRPGYDGAVGAAIAHELELGPGSRVLDLAAGTGLLSHALMDVGLDVVAVEPLEDMRARLAETVGAKRALAGTAEAIPLPEASVDAVAVADAFHWFDQGAAVAEIRRVLRPVGGVAVLWSAPSWRSDSEGWPGELARLLGAHRENHPQSGAREVNEVFAEAGGFAPVRRVELVSEREFAREDIVAYAASISWIGVMPDEQRQSVLGEVDALLGRHGVERVAAGLTTLLYVTRAL